MCGEETENPYIEILIPCRQTERVLLNRNYLPLCYERTEGRSLYAVCHILDKQTALARSGNIRFEKSPFILKNPDFIDRLRKERVQKTAEKNKGPKKYPTFESAAEELCRRAGFDGYTPAILERALRDPRNATGRVGREDWSLWRHSVKTYGIVLPRAWGLYTPHVSKEPVVAYLETVSEIPGLAEEEARRLLRRIKRGNERAKVEFANRLVTVVPEAVDEFLHTKFGLTFIPATDYSDELIEIANLTLATLIANGAIERWGLSSRTGVLGYIKERIIDELGEYKDYAELRSPRHVSSDRKYGNDNGIKKYSYDEETNQPRRSAMDPLEIDPFEEAREHGIEEGLLVEVGPDEKENIAQQLAIFLKEHNLDNIIADCGISSCAVYIYGSLGIHGKAFQGYSNLNVLFVTDGTFEQNRELLIRMRHLIGGKIEQQGEWPILLLGKGGDYSQDIRDGNGFVTLLKDNRLGSPYRGLATVEVASVNGYDPTFEQERRREITARLLGLANNVTGTTFEYAGMTYGKDPNGILVCAYPANSTESLGRMLRANFDEVIRQEKEMHSLSDETTTTELMAEAAAKFERKQDGKISRIERDLGLQERPITIIKQGKNGAVSFTLERPRRFESDI
jgi:hypothetical protein